MGENKFEFKTIEEMVDWYFETSYGLIEDRYTNPFQRKAILRVVKGMQKGLIENIKIYKENESSIIRKSCKHISR